MNLFFDLETKDYIQSGKRPQDLRMSIAVVMNEEDTIWVFDETQVVDLIRLLMAASLVVGFNVIYFDYGVLSRYPLGWSTKKIKTVDIFKDIKSTTGDWPSLKSVALETVNSQKYDVDPVALYRSGKLHEVIEYCKRDVDITRKVYIYGRKTGKVKYKNRSGKTVDAKVTWSI